MEYDLLYVPLTDNFYLTTYKLENKKTNNIKAKFIEKLSVLISAHVHVR